MIMTERSVLLSSASRISNLGVVFTDMDGSPYSSASQMHTLTPFVLGRMTNREVLNDAISRHGPTRKDPNIIKVDRKQ